MTSALWLAVILAGLISLVVPVALRPALGRAGILDVPNHRSSHSKPTLRGGGLAPLMGIAAGGIVVLAGSTGVLRQGVALIVLMGVVTGLVGFAEDIKGLPVARRAVFQFLLGGVLAAGLSWLAGTGWVWIPVAALFFAAHVNFTNFMDGVNGISGLHGSVVGVAYAVIGASEGSTALVVGGLMTALVFAAFLPWNLIPPGFFLGDVGSYLLGGMVGGLALFALWAGISPIAALAPVSIYWVDTVGTLLKRLSRREQIFEAHRTHIYQQITDLGFTHIGVAIVVAVLTAFASGAGLLGASGKPGMVFLSLLLLVLVWATYLTLPRTLAKRGSLRR